MNLPALYNKKDNYDLRIINYIRKSIYNTKNDTIIFTGKNIPFKDGINDKYSNDWYVEKTILQLIKKGKVQLFDKHKKEVKVIMTKKVGRRRKGCVEELYINKITNDVLFHEILFLAWGCPYF